MLFSVCLSRGSEQLYGERTGERREVGQADGWMERAGEMRMEGRKASLITESGAGRGAI